MRDMAIKMMRAIGDFARPTIQSLLYPMPKIEILIDSFNNISIKDCIQLGKSKCWLNNSFSLTTPFQSKLGANSIVPL